MLQNLILFYMLRALVIESSKTHFSISDPMHQKIFENITISSGK